MTIFRRTTLVGRFLKWQWNQIWRSVFSKKLQVLDFFEKLYVPQSSIKFTWYSWRQFLPNNSGWTLFEMTNKYEGVLFPRSNRLFQKFYMLWFLIYVIWYLLKQFLTNNPGWTLFEITMKSHRVNFPRSHRFIIFWKYLCAPISIKSILYLWRQFFPNNSGWMLFGQIGEKNGQTKDLIFFNIMQKWKDFNGSMLRKWRKA